MLLSLNYDILTFVLTEWSDVIEFALLDSAICNQTIREHFLALISSPKFVHKSKLYCDQSGFISWLLLRSIRMSKLKLTENLTSNMSREVFELISFSTKIHRLKIDNCTQLNKIIAVCGNKLDCLELLWTDSGLDVVNFNSILALCPNLRELDVSSANKTGLSNSYFSKLASKLSYLESLDFCFNDKLTSNTLLKIVNGCNGRMKRLKLPYKVTDKLFTEIIKCCPLMVHLSIADCRHISEDVILQMSVLCPLITSLDAEFCNQLTDKTISTVIQQYPKLTNLNVSGCEQLTDCFLVNLARNCPLLRNIFMSGVHLVTDSGLGSLATYCVELVSLNVDCCSLLSDVSITVLGTYCTKLERLNLDLCRLVTDQSLMCVIDNCPFLTSIGTKYMKLVDTPLYFSHDCNELHFLYDVDIKQDFYRLNRQSKGQGRVEFQWRGCLMTEATMVSIPSQCANVTKLMLNGKHRWKFEDVNLFPILDACPFLVEFKLMCCNGVTVVVLDKLIEKCPLLHSLTISYIQNMNDDALVRFVASKPNLKKLCLRKFSGQLSIISTASVCKLCPLLQYLDVSDWSITRAVIVECILPKLTHLHTLVVFVSPEDKGKKTVQILTAVVETRESRVNIVYVFDAEELNDEEDATNVWDDEIEPEGNFFDLLASDSGDDEQDDAEQEGNDNEDQGEFDEYLDSAEESDEEEEEE